MRTRTNISSSDGMDPEEQFALALPLEQGTSQSHQPVPEGE
jgi:hypothetical protein